GTLRPNDERHARLREPPIRPRPLQLDHAHQSPTSLTALQRNLATERNGKRHKNRRDGSGIALQKAETSRTAAVTFAVVHGTELQLASRTRADLRWPHCAHFGPSA